jgi:DNA-binding transcriptional LysR family regulator
VNITAVNLNLLLAFEALFEEQNVSRAATRIGLSQPAMSNALARLREVFGDPLFQRKSRGMRATPRALELAGPVRNGLAQLRSALAERPGFDPAASTRSFRIAMTDYAELVLLGPLLRSVARTSPAVQIVVRRVERIFVPPEADLRAGTFDAAIGFFPEVNALDPRTRSVDLFAEENVCIARQGHPLMRKRFTLREFASAGHVGVFYRDDTRVGLVDNILAGHGLRRRLQATTPHFLSAVSVVAESDLIAVVPAGLAARFRKPLRLEVRKTPLRLPTFHMRLLWYEHGSDDPAQQWLRSEIVAATSPKRPQSTARGQAVTPRRAGTARRTALLDKTV